jgi:hypothetical protein
MGRGGKSSGGAAGEAGGGASDGIAGQLGGEEFWLKLWAFGTSPYGLGLPEFDFWLLTPREYAALKAEWNRAHGIAPPLTKEQQANLDFNKKWIADQQIKALRKIDEKRKARASGLRAVQRVIPAPKPDRQMVQ